MLQGLATHFSSFSLLRNVLGTFIGGLDLAQTVLQETVTILAY